MTLESLQRAASSAQSSQNRATTTPPANLQSRGLARTLTAAPGYVLNPDGYPAAILTTGQIQKAITWYQNNAALYTPRVITAVQQRLNLSATGKVDLGFVKAVARWQATYDLEDSSNRLIPLRSGKAISAYPATGVLTAEQLSKLFPAGLASDKNVRAFASSALDISRRWRSLGSQEKRRQAVYRLLQTTLAIAGVYEPTFVLKLMDEATRGTFSATAWTLTVNSDFFHQKEATEQQIQSFLLTLFHEARHADQLFTALRYLAGLGRTAKQIAAETKLDSTSKPVLAALQKPVAPDSPLGIVAQEWYHSYFGKNRGHRQTTLHNMNLGPIIAANERELRKQTAAQQVVTSALKTATGSRRDVLNREKERLDTLIGFLQGKLNEQRPNYARAERDYRLLPEERDAWDTAMNAAKFVYNPEYLK
ncbi:hypothetical protein [Deinococcus kurensis]|uniref:hypothetical protein n=1 Tax=Deinococcus kurensis TaxID=2662757 RepID=UPI0012D2B1F2|nr:hypothetical protein [Deinococcus kurensis]